MRIKKILSLAAAFAAPVIPAFPQFDFGTSGSRNSSGAATIQVRPPASAKMMRFVDGVPYSARQSMESVLRILQLQLQPPLSQLRLCGVALLPQVGCRIDKTVSAVQQAQEQFDSTLRPAELHTPRVRN